MLCRLALVLLCSLSTSGHGGGEQEKSFDDVFEEGWNALKALDFRLAARRFHQTMKLKPKHFHSALFLGECLYRLGEFEKARKALARAYKLDPKDRNALRLLSDAIAATGNFSEALWHFGQIAKPPLIALPPLSDALVEPWILPSSEHPVQQLASVADARVFFVDLEGVPDEALSTLRNYLNAEVLGEDYRMEFQSSSVSLKPLGSRSARIFGPASLLEQAIEQLRANLPPAARAAAHCAEWWVHRRPPTKLPGGVKRFALEGHPFHWDNDGQEAGGENPLFTSLLYLTPASGSAAPTVVLNTSKTESGFYIGDAAWVIPAAVGRVAYMHGGMIHGVLPSAGAIELPEKKDTLPPARLSLNVAWWPWKCRIPEKVPSVEKVPPVDPTWAESLGLGRRPKFKAPYPVLSVFCGEDLCGRRRQEL